MALADLGNVDFDFAGRSTQAILSRAHSTPSDQCMYLFHSFVNPFLFLVIFWVEGGK